MVSHCVSGTFWSHGNKGADVGSVHGRCLHMQTRPDEQGQADGISGGGGGGGGVVARALFCIQRSSQKTSGSNCCIGPVEQEASHRLCGWIAGPWSTDQLRRERSKPATSGRKVTAAGSDAFPFEATEGGTIEVKYSLIDPCSWEIFRVAISHCVSVYAYTYIKFATEDQGT